MIDVTFSDGTVVQFEEGSNSLSLIKKVSKLGDLDAIRSLFTKDNVTGMTINGETVSNVVPVGMSIASTPSDAEEIIAIFTNRPKTDIELIREEQELQNEMIDFMAMSLM